MTDRSSSWPTWRKSRKPGTDAGLPRKCRSVCAPQSGDPFIAQASMHLSQAGGKRFRPMLTLLAAELGSGVNGDVVTAATGVELTHLASLYHDDVMDEADLRRGVVSANGRYGNSDAILVGDLLFGKASELVAGLGPEAVKIQAQTFVRLCSGQIRDARPAPEGADPIDYYLGVLADKTGVLIATAARYGAMFSGCPPETADIMGNPESRQLQPHLKLQLSFRRQGKQPSVQHAFRFHGRFQYVRHLIGPQRLAVHNQVVE